MTLVDSGTLSLLLPPMTLVDNGKLWYVVRVVMVSVTSTLTEDTGLSNGTVVSGLYMKAGGTMVDIGGTVGETMVPVGRTVDMMDGVG